MTNEERYYENLVQYSIDLVQAEKDEDFELCELINTAIILMLQSYAMDKAVKSSKPIKSIVRTMYQEKKLVYDSVKENR